MLTEKDFTPEEWEFIKNSCIQLTQKQIVDIDTETACGYEYNWLLARLSEVPPQYQKSCKVTVRANEVIELSWYQPKTHDMVLHEIEKKKREADRYVAKQENMYRSQAENMGLDQARIIYKYLKERFEGSSEQG